MSAIILAAVVLVNAVATGADQNREIVLAAWQAVADHFYDPHLRGQDWKQVRADLIGSADNANTPEELEQIIYELFAKLNNSHSGLSTPAERARRAAMLPLVLNRVGDRLFVEYVQPSDRQSGIQYGDEVLEIDGVKPAGIWYPATRFHRSVQGNPLYGASGSEADVVTRRSNQQKKIKLSRVRGGYRPEEAVESKILQNDIFYIRLNALGADIPAGRLRALFHEAAKHQGTILDLRDCPGGDMKASAVLASIILGPDKDYYTVVPRAGKLPAKVYSKNPVLIEDIAPDVRTGTAVLIRTYVEDVQFRGRFAVLANTRTASEPEAFVAAIKTHRRGRVFGTRTQGATHGWSVAVPLPHKFGAVAIPYTRTVMADGDEYEGRGVDPDVDVSNTAEDYAAGRDAILSAAMRYLASGR